MGATNATSTTHRNAPFGLRSTDETAARTGHSRSVPPRIDGEASTATTPVFEAAGLPYSGTTSGASSVVITPLDDCGGSNTGGGSIGSTMGQEAFLVLLRRPIIWVKPSAFDRGKLLRYNIFRYYSN